MSKNDDASIAMVQGLLLQPVVKVYLSYTLKLLMKSIRTNFTIIVSKQKQLGYYGVKLLRQPASLKDIRRREEALGLKFNDELIELYSFADGTGLKL